MNNALNREKLWLLKWQFSKITVPQRLETGAVKHLSEFFGEYWATHTADNYQEMHGDNPLILNERHH